MTHFYRSQKHRNWYLTKWEVRNNSNLYLVSQWLWCFMQICLFSGLTLNGILLTGEHNAYLKTINLNHFYSQLYMTFLFYGQYLDAYTIGIFLSSTSFIFFLRVMYMYSVIFTSSSFLKMWWNDIQYFFCITLYLLKLALPVSISNVTYSLRMRLYWSRYIPHFYDWID